MVYGYGGYCGFSCQSQCPPCEMIVQPPCFRITVPGPMLSCSNDTLDVDCNAPCGYGFGGWGGYGCYGGGYGGGYGGYGCGRGFGGWGSYNACGSRWGRLGWGGWGGCGW